MSMWVLWALLATASGGDRFVLVWADATLSAGSGADAATFQLTEGVDRAAQPDAVRFARLVREDGDRVVVETPAGPSDRHCHPPLLGNGLAVMLAVARADLAQVVVKPVGIGGDTPTLTLQTGAVLHAKTSHAGRGTTVTLSEAAPDDAVGWVYEEDALAEPVDQQAMVDEGGARWIAADTPMTAAATVHLTEQTPARKAGPTTEMSLMHVHTACVDVQGEVPSKALSPLEKGTSLAGRPQPTPAGWHVLGGASLRWQGGAKAGIVATPTPFPADVVQKDGDNLCAPFAAGKPIVCFEREKATLEKRPLPPLVPYESLVHRGGEKAHFPTDLPLSKKENNHRCDIEFTLDTGGRTSDVSVDNCVQPFRRICEDAAETWTFDPYLFETEAIEVRSRTSQDFIVK